MKKEINVNQKIKVFMLVVFFIFVISFNARSEWVVKDTKAVLVGSNGNILFTINLKPQTPLGMGGYLKDDCVIAGDRLLVRRNYQYLGDPSYAPSAESIELYDSIGRLVLETRNIHKGDWAGRVFVSATGKWFIIFGGGDLAGEVSHAIIMKEDNTFKEYDFASCQFIYCFAAVDKFFPIQNFIFLFSIGSGTNKLQAIKFTENDIPKTAFVEFN